MKHTLCKLGLAVLLCALPLFGQVLNVFTENDDAKIYIDEELVGYRMARQVPVDYGSHLVRVELGKRTIFSEVVTINDDIVKTIKVERFVGIESPVANRGAIIEEAKRAREGRGNIAVGLNGSYLPGLSVKGHLHPRFGLQATGWMFSFNDERYSSWEARTHVALVNTLINKMPGSLYLATGYGERRTAFDVHEVFDVTLGVEASLAGGNKQTNLHIHDRESLMTALLASLLFLDNAYISGELGYGSITGRDGSPNYQGITGRIGLHYYF